MFNDFDLEKLKQEGQDAENQKQIYGALGAVAKGFDNIPSSYNLLYGKGQQKGNTSEIFDNLQKSVGDPWEKQKKTYEAYKAAKEGQELESDNDQNSAKNKAISAMLIKQGKANSEDLNGLSYNQKVQLYGNPGALEEIKAKAQVDFNNDMLKQKASQNFQAGENEKNRQAEFKKEDLKRTIEQAKKSDPNERLKSLSGTDKARFDNALMVLKGIDGMGTALDSGQNTFSLVGDNDYTRNERTATEAYGRMQSGGAINKEEEGRFSKTLPGNTDMAEIQRKKLLSQREEMLSRLKTLGFTADDVGYKPTEFKYGSTDANKKITDPLSEKAQASGKIPVKKLFNAQQNKTKVVYQDGTEEILDGRR